MDYENCAFLVYPDNENYDLGTRLIEPLEKTGFLCWVSPLHEPDEEISRSHYHVLCYCCRRWTSLFKLKQHFRECGVYPANDFIFHIGNGKKDFRNYLLYLTHRTANSRNKQQFPYDVRPIPVNQPAIAYESMILPDTYIDDVMAIITKYDVKTFGQLFNIVKDEAIEIRDFVFSDSARWTAILQGR